MAAARSTAGGGGAGPPFVVPFLRNPGFVGRQEDLAEVHALLQKREAVAVRPVAAAGMGGIGKTQLAVEYAYRYAGEYPGGVYWVNAANDWHAELAALAERVGLREDDAEGTERQRRLALAFATFLEAHAGALVVFDNVEDPPALRDPAHAVVPAMLPCRLLFTTRRRDRDSPFASFEVRVLPDDFALQLLLSSEARRGLLVAGGGGGAELEVARAICRALGNLPLAIVLAAAYLGKSPRMALSDYLGRLRRDGGLATADDAGRKVDPRNLGTRHDAAVEATLGAQWEALESEDARRVLKTAALLGEAAEVSRGTLSLLTGLSDVAAGGYGAPLEEALGELAGWSLVEELGEREVRLHPLVREFAERRIGDAGREEFAADCAGNLGEALWEMGRLNDEVAARGVDAVLGDLAVGVQLSRAGEAGWIERLVRALDREAHCLRKWKPEQRPELLLQQVRNRCFEMGEEDGRELAEAALTERGLGYLRERVRSGRESEALVRTLEGHTDGVNGVAVTADGRWVVSASEDNALMVWDLGSGKLVRTLEGHISGVTGVAVTADGRWAVSASHNHTLMVWDLGSGQVVGTLKGHTSGAGGVAMTTDGRWAVSASYDTTLKVWDLRNKQLVYTLQGHTDEVIGVAVTADGRWAVSASYDTTLKVWDLRSGQLVHTLEGHTQQVAGVAATADGRWAVSASYDRTLKVWDLRSGQLVRTLEGHTHYVTSVAVTVDGRWVVSASSDQTLKIWELRSGQLVRTLEGHTSIVTAVTITADGRWVVSASYDRTLKVWDLRSGQNARAFEGHAWRVNGVAVTTDGCWAVSASHDGTLKVWDLGNGEIVRTLEGHTDRVNGVAVTADGRWAVSASGDKTLKVWDLSNGRIVRTLEGHVDWVTGVAVTTDGRWAISASRDQTLKVWDLSNGRMVRTLKGLRSGIAGVAVTADGCWAVSMSYDQTLATWELISGQLVRMFKNNKLYTFGVAVILTLTGTPDLAVTPRVAVTIDGRWAVSASYLGTLTVWDLGSGQIARTLEGHSGSVAGMTVTADGRWAVFASHDKTLRIWDMTTGLAVAVLETHAPLLCCAVASDRLILAGDDAGALHILDWLPPDHPATPAFPVRTAPRRPSLARIPPPELSAVVGLASELRWSAKLTGAEHKDLTDALLSAFPTRDALAHMLRFELDMKLDEIAAPGNLRTTVFELVSFAEAQGWVPRLFEAALARVPGNSALRVIAAKRQT